MKSFEDFVSQYAQDIPENTTRIHNSTLESQSLNIVAERVRFCMKVYPWLIHACLSPLEGELR